MRLSCVRLNEGWELLVWNYSKITRLLLVISSLVMRRVFLQFLLVHVCEHYTNFIYWLNYRLSLLWTSTHAITLCSDKNQSLTNGAKYPATWVNSQNKDRPIWCDSEASYCVLTKSMTVSVKSPAADEPSTRSSLRSSRTKTIIFSGLYTLVPNNSSPSKIYVWVDG